MRNYNRLKSTYVDFESIDKFIACQKIMADSEYKDYSIHAATAYFAKLTYTAFPNLKPEETAISICDCDEELLKSFDVDSLVADVMREIQEWYDWGIFRINVKNGNFNEGDPCTFTFYNLKDRSFRDNKENIFVVQGYIIMGNTDAEGNGAYNLILYLKPYKKRVYNTTPIWNRNGRSIIIEEIQKGKRQQVNYSGMCNIAKM